MTTDQRKENLVKANRHRLVQKQLKRTLKEQNREMGTLMAREVIGDPKPEYAAMRVELLLASIKWVGGIKADALLTRAQVSPRRRLGQLTDHERLRLDLVLR